MKTIILVEDNPADARLTINAFNEAFTDHHIIHVRCGKELLQYLNCEGKFLSRKRINPALILLDLNMPELNGMEILKIIKSNREFKTIPVVILSLSGDDRDVTMSYEMGVNAYVKKDMDAYDFFNTIKIIGDFWGLTNKTPSLFGTH